MTAHRFQDRFQHRAARADDLPSIVAIYNSTIASRQVTADTEEVTVADRQVWFDAHLTQPNRPIWIVDGEAGEMLGWLSFSSFYGRPAYAGTVEISIYLSEKARGQGLGKYFLQQALMHAPSLGVHTVLGFIFGHNTPSLNLFAKFGFAVWAHLPEVAILDQTPRDLLILGRKCVSGEEIAPLSA